MTYDFMKWKTLSTEYLIRRKWLTARRDTVQLPDGRINEEYYILEYPDWVNVIAITKDGKFVMERQYRHGAGEVGCELPCGVMEPGESPLSGAQRELMEETGYGNGRWSKVMTISANPDCMTNRVHCFLALDVELVQEPHLDANEDLIVSLMDPDSVLELLENNQILNAQMVAPLYKYFMEHPRQF